MNGYKKNQRIYYFFPLASIGGTESVHADVMRALKDYDQTTYIRYEGNVWKGQSFAQSKEGKKEGRAMLPEFAKYSKIIFASRYMEAPRFGRFIRKLFIKRLAKKINSGNSIIIFWHRESLEYILPYIEDHVRLIDIVHNNSNNKKADPDYLLNDWAPRIDRRVLISKGLMNWITPLYQVKKYPEELYSRIRVVEHTVYIPTGLTEKKNESLQILFVGRDTEEKRLHLIYEIAEMCLKKNIKVQFSIIGPNKERFKELSNVHFYGTISNRKEINHLYSLADVILLTSSTEGFPKVIAEAMAYGVVPISTNVGGISAHISNGTNGYLTDPEHCVIESLNLIIKLSEIHTIKSKISLNAYLYAVDNFGFNEFKHKWRNIINEFS